MLAWHVARTEPMKGFQAETSLLGRGFDVFLPKVREEKRWSRGRTHESIRPLVAGYLFINFDVDVDGWQRVNDARGVLGLMYSAPEVPVRIPDVQLLPLLGMCTKEVSGWFVPKAEANRFKFKVGQIVRVVDGPFAQFTAKVKAATFDKIKVDVFIFGRETPVEGDSTMFEPV